MKVCIVSSCGGHLTESLFLKPAYEQHDFFYVLNDKVVLSPDMQGKTCFIAHSERDWKFFLNLWEAFRILRKKRPDVILSTGAGPAVPFALIGRLLGICVVYVETITSVRVPSLTGRIMYRLANIFYYQWETLGRYFPRGICGGPIL